MTRTPGDFVARRREDHRKRARSDRPLGGLRRARGAESSDCLRPFDDAA